MLTNVDNWSFLPEIPTWPQPDRNAGVTFSESYDSGSGSIPSEDMILFFPGNIGFGSAQSLLS